MNRDQGYAPRASLPEGAREPRRRLALVTGASGGIGAELARILAAEGHDLILVARNTDALDALARELRDRHDVSARAIAADLSRSGAAERLWVEVVEARSTVDVLINNAGVGLYGLVAEQDLDALGGMIELNVTALTGLTRLALPGMLQRGWGRILNVASVVALQPGGPRMAAYYGTKAFVLSFSRGLAAELRGTDVSVTAVCPGPSRTSFDQGGAAATPLYRWVPATSARAVAEAAYRGLQRKRGVVLPGLVAKLMAVAGALAPPGLVLEVNRMLLTPISEASRRARTNRGT